MSSPQPNTNSATVPQTPHPIADLVGIFNDNPLWDEVMREVHAFREQRDAEDRARLDAELDLQSDPPQHAMDKNPTSH